MIRKLLESDRKIVSDFLSHEPAINLFILGDVENFGFDKEFQELWGSFDKNHELKGVLLRFHENYIPYYINDEFDISEFKSIIESDENMKIISGKENIVDNFRDVLLNKSEKSTYFCELRKASNLRSYTDRVRIATLEDAQRVYNLLEEIEEFQATDTNSVERIERKIKTNTGRIYYIENDKGEIISVSQTTAENSKSAMVVGVATRKGYRRKGLMSECLSKLCYDLLSEGKVLCLFYDNPEAGRVYHSIGFESIGKWKMLIKK